jgi:hypothetical protein
MADEESIYLNPEEELTSVRERLERSQARRIILIIPQQTQLRSHVGWRLIHARMRELGKELLVVSPNRQVRAVARAAGFKVAESQEATSSRPRPGGGTQPGAITTRRSRFGSRGGPESRVSQLPGGRSRAIPGASNKPLAKQPTPVRPDYEEEATLERPGKQSRKPGGDQPVASTFFEERPENFGPSYDFHISATPSVRPSVPRLDEGDEDLARYYDDDYHTAQSIRESARAGSDQPGKEAPPTDKTAPTTRASAAGKWDPDPYDYMKEDHPLAPLPEQKGSVPGPIEEVGMDVPDISDRSTEIMESEIEDLGDMGAVDLPEIRPSQEPEKPAPRPREGQRPRTGQMQPRRSPRAPRPVTPDFDDEDLLALPDRSVRGGTPPARPSRGLAGAAPRQSQALRQGQSTASPTSGRPRPAPAPAPVPQQRPPSRQLPPPATPARPPISPRRAPRRGTRGLTLAFSAVILLLLVVGLLFYFVPTATVTISLQAQTYSSSVQLNATANPQANVSNRVPAQMLAQDFSASGQGTASGTTRVGNAHAQGLVSFTNNGSVDVTIPTGTVIATQSGIQFVTGAEALVSHVAPNNTIPAVPVSAQQAGDSGNVPAHSITTIPDASRASIARYNHTSPTAINLTVDNPNATSGGGATNVPAVTAQDREALAKTLHQKLQQEVKAWLAEQLHPGDVRGVLVPNVLNSADPLPEEQLNGVPGIGQAATGGVFSGTLSLHVKVLVARAANLQAAAGAQLNAAALKLRPASTLATQLPVTLTNVKSTPSKDGNTLAISAKASGSIVRQLSVASGDLAGKSTGEVVNELKGLTQAGIENVQVAISPAFLSILPLKADHIRIILQPVQQTPPKNVPNG